jgi:hypothetical protein
MVTEVGTGVGGCDTHGWAASPIGVSHLRVDG